MTQTATPPEPQPQQQQPQQQPPPTTTTPRPPTATTPHIAERRIAVGVAITLAGLLFLLTAGLLYFRWATMREPTCVLIVEAPQALRGAEVIVDGLGVGPEPHRVTVGVGDRFAIPFYLDYGTYRVRVILNETTLFDEEFSLTREAPGRRLELWKLPLPLPLPTPQSTASSTAPTTPSAPPLGSQAETDDLPRLTPPSAGGRLSP